MENINEAINKARLLFSYDPKRTLTENIDSSELKEAGKGMINALDDLARGGKTAATELANATNMALKHMPGGEIKLLVTNSKGQLVSKVVKTGDDFAKMMKGGAKFADKAAAQNFSKALMKTPLPPTSKLRQTLTDKAADLASKSDEYKNLSKKEIHQLLKKKGYHPDVAAEIAQKADDIRGGSKKNFKKPDPSKPDPLNPDPNTPNKPNTPDPKVDVKTLTNKDLDGIKSILGKHWQYIEEMYRSGKKLAAIRKWALRIGLGLGAVYLFWTWLGKGDDEHPCPNGTVWDGTQCVTIPPIPITCPSGTVWNGSSCVRKGGGTTFTNCTDFPYTKGCQSSIIAEVQKCLGITADGKFGNGTLSALQSGGYGNSITKEVYDKIKAKCGGNTNDNTTITTTSDIIKVQSGDSIEW